MTYAAHAAAIAVATLTSFASEKAAHADNEKPAVSAPAQETSSGSPIQTAAIVLLLGGGLAALAYAKRMRGPAFEKDTLDILASRAVGPRTKIVLLAAGGRNFLLSVGDRGTTLIADFWPEGQDDPHEGPLVARDHELALQEQLEPQRPRAPTPRTASQAVAGLVELRKRVTGLPATPQWDDRSGEISAVFSKNVLRQMRGIKS